MSDHARIEPELKAIEAALASLAPTPPTSFDRDRLMYEAGRSSAGPRRLWLRGAATFALAAAALAVGRWTAAPIAPSPQTPIAYAPASPGAVADDRLHRLEPSSYLLLRNRIEHAEVVQTGASRTTPSSPIWSTRRRLLHELLN